MSVTLAIRSGALAGRTLTFDRDMFSVGRHPDCDLAFDAHKDIDVSGKHAEFVTIGPRTVVRDLGSTNGTWINGVRITGDSEVYSGDTIAFGEHGPVADVVIADGAVRPQLASPATRVSSGGVAGPVAGAGAAPPAASPAAAAVAKLTPLGTPPRSTQMKINAAVELTTRKMQRTLIVVAMVLGAAGIGAYLYAKKQGDDRILQLTASYDSAMATFNKALADARGKAGGMDTVLMRQAVEMRALRAQLAAGGSREEVDLLSRRLREKQRDGHLAATAAQMDLSAIYEKNGKAVALIIVEMPNGDRSAATAFSVDEKGVLVTNRHAVKDLATGAMAKRIAVEFNDTQSWLPAHVVSVSDGEDDIAILQLDRPGPFPVVAGVALATDVLRNGQPLAIIGFPLGVDIGIEGTGFKGKARASLNPGTVSKLMERLTQIDAYAAQGSSGSPVFDARGIVVGVVYGGPTDAQGKIVYAVPPARLLAEIRRK